MRSLAILLGGVVWAGFHAVAAASPPTIFPAKIAQDRLPSGSPLKVTYTWDATPMDGNYTIFVHLCARDGTIVSQDDYAPEQLTSKWAGRIGDTHELMLPANAADGDYQLIAGIYDKVKGRFPLTAGPGVNPGADTNSYVIGHVQVDHNAPPPPLDSAGPETLDLKNMRMTFDEEFDGPLDVSPWGPGTRWIAHTPGHYDFGDAAFTDPTPGFPFSIQNGILRIEARKVDGRWRAGCLASVDDKGRGFAQQYGYFECRARFPRGAGTWPAFWLLAEAQVRDKTQQGFEVDIVEQYGHAPQNLDLTAHWWPGQGSSDLHRAKTTQAWVPDMSRDFHRYGFYYNAQTMIWYFDSVEVWRMPTPPEARQPLFPLLDLALGGGWPIDQTPNPSVMEVDYVRVYAPAP